MDRIVVIKEYPTMGFTVNEASWRAELDAALLRENGIECSVDGSTIATIHPIYNTGVPIRLSVNEKDAEAAAALLNIDYDMD